MPYRPVWDLTSARAATGVESVPVSNGRKRLSVINGFRSFHVGVISLTGDPILSL